MKYSLKKEYKELLKEFDADVWNEWQDSYSDDKVRVIFPGDKRNIARIYNTKDNIEIAKQKDEINLEKDEEVQLNTISVINKGYLSCAKKYTDKQLEKGSSKLKFKKTIINLINNYCENKLVNDIINFSENEESPYSISRKLKEYKTSERENIIDYIKNETVYFSGMNNNNVNVNWQNYSTFAAEDGDSIKFTYDDFIDSTGLNSLLSPKSKSEFDALKKAVSNIDYNKEQISNDFDKFLSDIIDFCINVKLSFIDFKIQCKDLEAQEDDFAITKLKKSDVLKAILYEYCDNVTLPTFISDVKKLKNAKNIFRKECKNINEAIKHLNDNCNPFITYKGRGGNQGETKGTGEFHVHALLKTTNACQKIEPDAILSINNTSFPCSVKQFANQKKEAQTGGQMSSSLRQACNDFLGSLFKDSPKSLNSKDLTGESVPPSTDIINLEQVKDKFKFIEAENNLIVIDDKLRNECLEKYKLFKEQIASEHNAEGIIAYFPGDMPASQKRFNFISKEDCKEALTIAGIPSNERIKISVITAESDSRQRLDRILLYLLDDKYNHPENITLKNIIEEYNITSKEETSKEETSKEETSKEEIDLSYYKPQGKVLKEVYSHLFKKKLISEGGLAGHMMHPYEALDMTPRQIIDRIKEYITSQKIIEKVDGQNLFFTVEKDGTLMFARNKEDMTHDDLVEKFTNHPAEVPFVTGGNAIKKGVDQWLSSAGEFGQQEILDIFHPDGEARSFINFEIMHKDHPNQLEYGENFIVLHSIIDFVDGREAVYSSNNSQRLDKLINLIKQGVESLGYTLASNRTVDLNKLTNVQVSHYVNRVKEVASQLDITEDEFLGDGVEKQIKKQLETEDIDISDEAIKMLYDFALYGEDKSGNNIKSKDFTSLMQSEDVKKLRSINLTSANKAAAKVRSILSPFKEIFVDLGIDLLDGVPSSYVDSETDLANIDSLRDKLETAIDDLSFYMDNTSESDWDSVVNRLKPHYDKVIEVGIENTVSTSVEGGVYDYQGDLLKVTGGFAPLNQVLGAAYRDKKGIFPTFKQKFIQQESNRRSLKDVFNLIF